MKLWHKMNKWLKRFIIASIFLTILYNALGFMYGYGLAHHMSRVAVWWRNDTLIVTSLTGGKVITALVGESNQKTAIATFDRPYILFDSGIKEITKETFDQLDWRSIEGEKISAPPIHSEIKALYYLPKYSEWEGDRIRKEGEDD